MMGRICETGSGGATKSCEAGDVWNARVAYAVGALHVRLTGSPLKLCNKERGTVIVGWDKEKRVKVQYQIHSAEFHGRRDVRTGFGSNSLSARRCLHVVSPKVQDALFCRVHYIHIYNQDYFVDISANSNSRTLINPSSPILSNQTLLFSPPCPCPSPSTR